MTESKLSLKSLSRLILFILNNHLSNAFLETGVELHMASIDLTKDLSGFTTPG